MLAKEEAFGCRFDAHAWYLPGNAPCSGGAAAEVMEARNSILGCRCIPERVGIHDRGTALKTRRNHLLTVRRPADQTWGTTRPHLTRFPGFALYLLSASTVVTRWRLESVSFGEGTMNLWIALAIGFSLASCASVSSKEKGPQRSMSGIVYRLPKRAVDIQITFEDQKPPKIDVSDGASYADTNHIYTANLGRNLIGKFNSEIKVSEAGLLDSTKSSFTNQLDQLFTAWSGSPQDPQRSRDPGDQPQDSPYAKCPKDGVVSLSFILNVNDDPVTKRSIRPDAAPVQVEITEGCTLKVAALRAWQQSSNSTPKACQARKGMAANDKTGQSEVGGKEIPTRDSRLCSRGAGFFYRINLPYIVTATIGNVTTEHIALLPDESETYFVGNPRVLFANASNTTDFSNGVLTSTEQWTDGEIVAAFKMPADLIRAYTGAIGAFFDSFRKRSDLELKADAKEALDAHERVKIAACLDAISKDPKNPELARLCTIGLPTPN